MQHLDTPTHPFVCMNADTGLLSQSSPSSALAASATVPHSTAAPPPQPAEGGPPAALIDTPELDTASAAALAEVGFVNHLRKGWHQSPGKGYTLRLTPMFSALMCPAQPCTATLVHTSFEGGSKGHKLAGPVSTPTKHERCPLDHNEPCHLRCHLHAA